MWRSGAGVLQERVQRSPSGSPRGEASSQGDLGRAGRTQTGVPAGGDGRIRSAGVFKRRQRPGDQDRQQEVHEADGGRGNGQHHGRRRRREGGDERGRSCRGTDGGSENLRIASKRMNVKSRGNPSHSCLLSPRMHRATAPPSRPASPRRREVLLATRTASASTARKSPRRAATTSCRRRAASDGTLIGTYETRTHAHTCTH